MTSLRTLAVGALLVFFSALAFACASEDDPEQQAAAQAVEQDQPAEPGQQQTVEIRSRDTDQQERSSTGGSVEQQQEAEQAQAAADTTSSDQQHEQQQGRQQGQQQGEPQSSAGQAQADAPEQQAEAQSVQQEQPEQSQSEAQPEAEQEQEQTAQSADPPQRDQLTLRAEEIRAQATAPELTGLNGWLNGEETLIALELAKGNVVLIDFWTYTCINCVRTLPFLTSWDQKYRDHGLVIIGVHTPEFAFEERVENVRTAIAEHDIEYLVAIDNDYQTWRALQGRRGWWPRKFLIGPTPDGSPMGVRYDHIGEGDYEETEVAIRAALEAVGKDLSDVPFGVDVAVPTRGATPGRQTRELYAGWSRNNGGGGPYAGQEAYFLAGPGIPTFYTDIPSAQRQHNLWYLQGVWETDRESIVHARETNDLEDYIALLVRGRTANVVLTVAEDGEPFNVYVELDGNWLQRDEAGSHIQWDDEGRSYIRVTENDLYRLVFLPEWSEHELKLSSNSDQFRIFAFTFGSYVGGE